MSSQRIITDIAIIDDDLGICAALSSLMRSMGYNIHLFDCAEAFLAQRSTIKIDCIFTDVQMPGVNGITLQRQLKKLLPQMPIIIMTAYPDESIRKQALANGARFFLSKPFSAEMIQSCLEEISADRNNEKQ